MNRFPYSTDPVQAFDQMEAEALFLENLAGEREETADVIEKMEGGSREAANSHRITAKRLRRIASCLGYMAGRVDRLHLLNDPVRRESTYGGSSQRSVA